MPFSRKLQSRNSGMSPTLDQRDGSCEPANPANTVTDRLNSLLANGGDGYVLSLCPSAQYIITAPILFAAPNQEISTAGYPSDGTRATLVVDGPVADGAGHTTAIDGTCATCSGIKIRHIQVNGTRLGAPPTSGGANIEIGGPNTGQLVEFTHSFDPRSWSCLHIAEGGLSCANATIQNNDIGPAGSDAFQQWADGISNACAHSTIRNNMVNNPTDGGIVLFGAPGTQVYNNTVWVETQTLLGGINLVDYAPWNGNYTGTVVHDNTIVGAFSDENAPAGDKAGTDSHQVMIKIGIAVGPRTWFGDQYGWNLSTGGEVRNNKFTGAFGYAMAVGSAADFTVQGNTLVGNTAFIGSDGPNCTKTESMPALAPFVFDANNTRGMHIQDGFTDVPTLDGLTCVMPPANGDFWPFGGNPSGSSSNSPNAGSGAGSAQHGLSAGAKAGEAFGIILALAAFAALVVFGVRKARAHRLATPRRPMSPTEKRGLRQSSTYPTPPL